MKSLKYILSGLALLVTIAASARQFEGIVYLADEPVKGAKVLDEAQNVLATSDKEGKISFDTNEKNGVVIYKDVTMDVVFKAKEVSAITLIPAEEALLEMIQENPSVKKCEIFLANYDKSKALKKVMNKKEEMIFSEAYLAAVKEYDVTKLESYLNMYDSAKYEVKAEKTIEIISWQMARLNNTIDSYQDYLAKFPDSEAAKEAAQRLAEVDY